MLPLDLEINPSATVDQILASKTVFAHSGDQSCGLWVPNVFGLAAWTTENSFTIHEQREVSIVGVSSLRDMSWSTPAPIRAVSSSVPAMCVEHHVVIVVIHDSQDSIAKRAAHSALYTR